MHRLIVEVEPGMTGSSRLSVIRQEPLLAAAIVAAVREVEGHGYKVTGIATTHSDLCEAAQHVLGLRKLASRLSEEELALLLDLLPL